jgi:hypothetical protein
MVDVDHEEVRERKGAFGGCGAGLETTGDIGADDRRAEAFECRRETCGYREWRMDGDGYTERHGE